MNKPIVEKTADNLVKFYLMGYTKKEALGQAKEILLKAMKGGDV